MYNTEETSMGTRLPHTELSDSHMGGQAHAGIRFELPEPPLTSPEKLERLKTESVNNPDAILNFLKESEAAKVQYYKDITVIMEKQVNAISEQAESAKRQTEALSKQVNVQEKQLIFTKSEAASSKKDARFAKFTSVAAILVSIAAIVVPLIFG